MTTWLYENPIPCASFNPKSCAEEIIFARIQEEIPALAQAVPPLFRITADKVANIAWRTSVAYSHAGALTAVDTFVAESADALATAASVMATGFVDSLITNWNTYSKNLMITEHAIAGNLSSGNPVGAYLAAQRGVINVGVPAQRFGEQTVGTLAAAWGLANAGVTAIEVGVNVLKTPITLTPALVTVGGRTMASAGTLVGEAEGLAGSLGTAGANMMAMAGDRPLGYSTTYQGSPGTRQGAGNRSWRSPGTKPPVKEIRNGVPYERTYQLYETISTKRGGRRYLRIVTEKNLQTGKAESVTFELTTKSDGQITQAIKVTLGSDGATPTAAHWSVPKNSPVTGGLAPGASATLEIIGGKITRPSQWDALLDIFAG